METKFQTSFIPKKPFVPLESTHVRHTGMSIFMILSVLLFIASLAAAGFFFVAKSYLLTDQEKLKVDLAANVSRFDVPLIEELKRVNIKIDLANQIFKSHVAVSEVFRIIEGLTIAGVRFSSFEFTDAGSTSATPNADKSFKIKMKGVANSYSSVAFQSDVFGKSDKYGTNKVIKNPVLSDLSVDDKGNVLFNFSADILLPDISYEKVLAAETGGAQIINPNE